MPVIVKSSPTAAGVYEVCLLRRVCPRDAQGYSRTCAAQQMRGSGYRQPAVDSCFDRSRSMTYANAKRHD